MRLSDLQNKNVINIEDGSLLGNIIDVVVDSKSGNILSLAIYGKRSISLLRGKEEVLIDWKQIKKIGEDVILVDKNM